MSTLLGIAVKSAKFAPMRAEEQGQLNTETGLLGDWRGKPGKRQITVLALTDWQTACAELGIERPWTDRRANLLLADVPKIPGSRIALGEAVLEVTGECDPCERMQAVHPGLFDALAKDWRGGVTCRVLQGGEIFLNMPAIFEVPTDV